MLPEAVLISAALVMPPGIYWQVNQQMAASHVGTINPGSFDTAVAKVIDFVEGRAFGVDKVQTAMKQYVNFFKDYQVSLVGSLDEPQQCYESDDDADFDDKEEMDLLYNLQHASPGDVIQSDNQGLCHVDHIPNTVKYSANLLQNYFMFLSITNVRKETVRFVIEGWFHSCLYLNIFLTNFKFGKTKTNNFCYS